MHISGIRKLICNILSKFILLMFSRIKCMLFSRARDDCSKNVSVFTVEIFNIERVTVHKYLKLYQISSTNYFTKIVFLSECSTNVLMFGRTRIIEVIFLFLL